MVEHPREGAHFPETLPTDEILNSSVPFLGKFVSMEVDWTPTNQEQDQWQLTSFLVDEPDLSHLQKK
jgi:homospermidine synthase